MRGLFASIKRPPEQPGRMAPCPPAAFRLVCFWGVDCAASPFTCAIRPDYSGGLGVNWTVLRATETHALVMRLFVWRK